MSDLLGGLSAALKPRKEGYTVRELIATAKLPDTVSSRTKVRHFLSDEIQAGRILGKIGRRKAIDGYDRTVPVYIPIATKQR